MTVTCPEGHPSESTDYCDVCGTPIPAAGSAAPAAPDPAADPAASTEGGETESGPVTCPNCGELSPGGSLFCENCGYDFTTGTPAPPPPPPAAPDPPAAAAGGPGGAPDGPSAAPGEPASAGVAPPSGTAGTPSPAGVPPIPGATAWVAEIWVDPDWYAHERPEDPLPSAGLPGLVTLRQRSLLVGRPSRSRGITPDIDCGSDPGVSRRHCQLTTDGQRWWVEDLGSSNGTFVASAGDPLPDAPLAQGIRQEIEEGDRLFLGAWTRLVIRKALPGEV